MPLALQVHDEEDLSVISAHLQDAVGVVGDMTYLPKQRRFALVVNRFVWLEGQKEGKKKGLFADRRPHRVRTGLHFDGVEAVKVKNLSPTEKDAAFELLAIRFENAGGSDDPSGTIELDFAGIGTLRLEVECIEGMLQDMGEPYPVKSKPRHPASG